MLNDNRLEADEKVFVKTGVRKRKIRQFLFAGIEVYGPNGSVPGVCNVSVSAADTPGGDAYEAFFFQISRVSKSVNFSYYNDLGESSADPVTFPVPVSDTFEPCWVMLGCDALPTP